MMRIAPLMFAAVFLIGLGYLAILPSFEGFDEYAYYSGIRQVADTGTIPIYGRSFIDQEAHDYESHGPMPWASGKPPFEKTGRMTYPSFFASSAAADYEARYRVSPANKSFAAGPEQNWEAQHPPLFFVLMAPVMRMADGFPFVTRIFVLRLACYLFACAAFVIGWAAVRSQEGKFIPEGVGTGYLYYPFLVPMFFSEFARIGNDSLCVLLVALIFWLSLGLLYTDDRSVTKPIVIGVLFGLGLLTKAFFVPLLGGYCLFMVMRAWQARHVAKLLRLQFIMLGLIVIPALLLGGGWYVYNFVAFGSPSGSFDSIVLAEHGGLIANLRQNFSVAIFVRDTIGILASWSWAGSWSLARISPLLHAPLLLLTAWIVATYLNEARRYPSSAPIWLTVWLFLPIFVGLLYHVLVVMALGSSGTPGWFLSILTPLLAVAVGYGLERIARGQRGRLVLGISLLYPVAFLVIAMWSQMALFAGCATKGDDKLYQFTGNWFCLADLPDVTAKLSVLGWPSLAFASLGGGFFCLAVVLWQLLTPRRPSNPLIANQGA